ncbi:MAG TPA: peptidoglycan-binding domain-containing protein [Candidatus Paceibacterota bacterium]
MKKTLTLGLMTTLLALSFAMTAQAAEPTITASETTANTSSSSIPAITFAGGAAAVAATATLTATTQANIVNNDYFIISHTGVAATSVCFYFDKSNALSDDSGTAAACQAANGVAGGVEINISGATTAAQVATTISSAINTVTTALTVTATDNLDGTLTLTNDTAGASGNIAVNANYWTEAVANAAFLLTALTGGTNAIAATAAITIPAGLVANAADHSVTIDGVVINLGTAVQTATQVATTIAGATYTGGTNYGVGAYTVGSVGDVVTYTKSGAGTAGNGSVAIADANYGAKAQVVTFTPAGTLADYRMGATINGTTYYGTGSTVQAVVESLNTAMGAITGVGCTEDDTKVTCTANPAGTAFTYGTAILPVNVVSGGNQTSGSSSTGSRQAVVWTGVTPTITATVGKIVTNSVMPKTNISVGAKGSAVVAIQEYLINKNVGVAAEALAEAGATGNFGPLTKKALAEFQKSVGISPATGNYGPATRAYIASH